MDVSLLSIRPPTPPSEACHKPFAQLNHQHEPDGSHVDGNLYTPPSNLSSEPSSFTTSGRRRRKVVFSAEPQYQEAPVYRTSAHGQSLATSAFLPSTTSKPTKGILKANTAYGETSSDRQTSFDNFFNNPQGEANLLKMLDSAILQLAGSDRVDRMDAYSLLLRALRGSNNLPDRAALQSKMPFFMRYLQRDIASMKIDKAAVESGLVVSALNLLFAFLSSPAIASTLTHEFAIFTMDHCIQVFNQQDAPKRIAILLMGLVGLQDFSPRVMTQNRVGRLVASLQDIDKRVLGKMVGTLRMKIYKKLVAQTKQHMAVHCQWLQVMFDDMVESAESRDAAISLGFQVHATLGQGKGFQKRVMEVLTSTVSDDQSCMNRILERLSLRTKADQSAQSIESRRCVPRIWSVVTALASLSNSLRKWGKPFYREWVLLLQACFNCQDRETKIEAHHAWARWVYLHRDEKAFTSHVGLLKDIYDKFTLKFRTPKQTPISEDLVRVALGGICNFLYCGFSANTSDGLLDDFWRDHARVLLLRLLHSATEEPRAFSCAMLMNLLGPPRMLNQDYSVDKPPMTPEQLPAINSKWIFRNTLDIFEVVEPIFLGNFIALADTTSAQYKLWQTMVQTITQVASKEIKVSTETAKFVAGTLNLLQKAWNDAKPVAGEAVLLAAENLIKTVTTALGYLPFTESRLGFDEQNRLMAIGTPKHRSGRAKAPIFYLFAMLSSPSSAVADDERFGQFMADMFAPFLERKNVAAQKDLALDFASALPFGAHYSFGSWICISDRVLRWCEASPFLKASKDDLPMGNECQGLVNILERGVRCFPNLPRRHWKALLDAVQTLVRDESGDAGVAMVVIEPLAKAMLDMPFLFSDNHAYCAADLLATATQPRDRQAVEAARRRLWGAPPAASKSLPLDSFDHLYKLSSHVSHKLYQEFHSKPQDRVVFFLAVLGSFLDRSNRQLLPKTLATIQDCLVPWVADSDRVLAMTASLPAVMTVWNKFLSLLICIEQPAQQVPALEPVLVAAFSSSHCSILNATLACWNRIFGDVKEMDYPDKLCSVLVVLQPRVDGFFPGLPAPPGEQAQELPAFDEPQEHIVAELVPQTGPITTVSPWKPSPALSKSPVSSLRRSARSRTGSPGSRAPQTPTARVRHDDAQIHFLPIHVSDLKGCAPESQVLAEDQKKVQDGQQENASLFPEIRSSSARKSVDTLPSVAVQQRAATPGLNSYHDFVMSTPTPRRGQLDASNFENDPPSSPLGPPRGNPLEAEIQSRSASASDIRDWQVMSSPISASSRSEQQQALQHRLEDAAKAVAQQILRPGDAHQQDEAEVFHESAEFPVPHDGPKPSLPASEADEQVVFSTSIQTRAMAMRGRGCSSRGARRLQPPRKTSKRIARRSGSEGGAPACDSFGSSHIDTGTTKLVHLDQNKLDYSNNCRSINLPPDKKLRRASVCARPNVTHHSSQGPSTTLFTLAEEVDELASYSQQSARRGRSKLKRSQDQQAGGRTKKLRRSNEVPNSQGSAARKSKTLPKRQVDVYEIPSSEVEDWNDSAQTDETPPEKDSIMEDVPVVEPDGLALSTFRRPAVEGDNIDLDSDDVNDLVQSQIEHESNSQFGDGSHDAASQELGTSSESSAVMQRIETMGAEAVEVEAAKLDDLPEAKRHETTIARIVDASVAGQPPVKALATTGENAEEVVESKDIETDILETQPVDEPGVETNSEEVGDETVAVGLGLHVACIPEIVVPEGSHKLTKVRVIMASLQSVMNELCSVSLTRADYNKIEDMFIEARRELLEAEKRGRAAQLEAEIA